MFKEPPGHNLTLYGHEDFQAGWHLVLSSCQTGQTSASDHFHRFVYQSLPPPCSRQQMCCYSRSVKE